MERQVDASFETLHLVSVLTPKFNQAYRSCGIEDDELYALAYLKSFGKHYVRNKKNVKIIQREHLAKVLKDVFVCNDNRCTDIFTKLEDSGLIEDFKVKRGEKDTVFGEGRTRALSLTENGIDKISEFSIELKKLYDELLDPDQHLLSFPRNEGKGDVASKLVRFLKLFKKARSLIK